MTSGSPVPATIAEMEPAWFTSILRARGRLEPDRSVAGLTAAPVGNGLVCDSVRFELAYDGATAAPASVVCKFPAADPVLRAGATAEQIYQREMTFYTDLARGVGTRVPECVHLARADGRDDAFVLVLEDLGPAVTGDQIEGADVDRARAVMDAAAALHAPWWDEPALDDAPWSVRSTWIPRISDTYADLFARYAQELGPRLDLEDLELGETFAPVIGRWFAEQPRPWTLTHGDFRLDNMLFDIQGGIDPVAVLDWQTILPGPGAGDVAYFLGACLPVETRRRHEQELLERYHAGLVARGVTRYAFDQCVRDYRYSAFLGYFMATYAPLLVKRTPRGDEMFVCWLQRVAAQIRDHDAMSLLPRP